MAKKITQKNFFSTSVLFFITSFILFIAVVFISGRYFEAIAVVNDYVSNIKATTFTYQNNNGEEDAKILATTIATVPAGYPLFVQSKQLQDYISGISKQTDRDLVITNNKEIILGDTIPWNIGTEYKSDRGEELLHTLEDGQTRHFTEISSDYPQTISETVVPIRDASSAIIGALIFSDSNIFK